MGKKKKKQNNEMGNRISGWIVQQRKNILGGIIMDKALC